MFKQVQKLFLNSLKWFCVLNSYWKDDGAKKKKKSKVTGVEIIVSKEESALGGALHIVSVVGQMYY